MPELDTPPAETSPADLLGVLPVGTRLRSYELTAVLGQGGFGITYRAHDSTLHRDVAIKEYLPVSLALRVGGTTVMPRSTELAGGFAWGRERFLDEARTLARLGHAPAIVRVHDFLEANGTAYMVMALAEGETLERRLQRTGPLAQPAVERLLAPLLAGLEQVHTAGFLHRDIKPANIIVDADGAPTLIDFGASRAAMAERSASMTAVFTPGYAAAEQFTSARQGPWTDIYGVAATLHCAIVGRPPPSAFDRIVHDTYPTLERLAPAGFAAGLLAAIDAGLAVQASSRPQSIADWRPRLQQTIAAFADAPTVALPKPAPRIKARRIAAWAAVPIAILLVLAAAYAGRSVLLRSADPPAVAVQVTRAQPARPPAGVDANELQKWCEDDGPDDRTIQGCTALIGAGNAPAKAYNARGFAYNNKGDYDRAIEDFDQAIHLKPDYATAHNNRGYAYAKKGQYDRAIEDFNQAIRQQSDFAQAYNNRGLAYKDKGSYDRAIEDFDQAIRILPDSPQAFANRGVAFSFKGNFDRALEDLDQSIKLKPDAAPPFSNRGEVYLHKGLYQRALEDLDHALELDPGYVQAFTMRGFAYIKLNRVERSVQDFNRAIALEPSYFLPFFGRGAAYDAQHQYDKAIRDYDQAIKLKPGFKLAIDARNAAYYAKDH